MGELPGPAASAEGKGESKHRKLTGEEAMWRSKARSPEAAVVP